MLMTNTLDGLLVLILVQLAAGGSESLSLTAVTTQPSLSVDDVTAPNSLQYAFKRRRPWQWHRYMNQERNLVLPQTDGYVARDDEEHHEDHGFQNHPTTVAASTSSTDGAHLKVVVSNVVQTSMSDMVHKLVESLKGILLKNATDSSTKRQSSNISEELFALLNNSGRTEVRTYFAETISAVLGNDTATEESPAAATANKNATLLVDELLKAFAISRPGGTLAMSSSPIGTTAASVLADGEKAPNRYNYLEVSDSFIGSSLRKSAMDQRLSTTPTTYVGSVNEVALKIDLTTTSNTESIEIRNESTKIQLSTPKAVDETTTFVAPTPPKRGHAWTPGTDTDKLVTGEPFDASASSPASVAPNVLNDESRHAYSGKRLPEKSDLFFETVLVAGSVAFAMIIFILIAMVITCYKRPSANVSVASYEGRTLNGMLQPKRAGRSGEWDNMSSVSYLSSSLLNNDRLIESYFAAGEGMGIAENRVKLSPIRVSPRVHNGSSVRWRNVVSCRETSGPVNENDVLNDVEVIENFISIDEETSLFNEAHAHLKRLRYETSHWDDAIHNYREIERSQWSPSNAAVIARIRRFAFPSDAEHIGSVHVLDIAKDGYVKPHVDSVRYCGDRVVGVSLLSDSVMRLRRRTEATSANSQQPASSVLDLLLRRRSLYSIRGVARYDYSHEILKDDESFFDGKHIPRERRISIMCRSEPKPVDDPASSQATV